MDGDDLASELRDEYETAFSRLGSSKAMYALTDGEMDGDRIRAAAVDDTLALSNVLDGWAEDPDDHATDEVMALLTLLSDNARERAADLVQDPSLDEEPSLYETLAAFGSTPARLGGLLGRYLVALERAGQMVGFFVGDADPTAADDFRELRSDLETERTEVADALGKVCDDADDWNDARDAAEAVIEAAYDDYVETLESLGIKPKNVC